MMLRIAVMPVSALLSYIVFFTGVPIEKLVETIDGVGEISRVVAIPQEEPIQSLAVSEIGRTAEIEGIAEIEGPSLQSGTSERRIEIAQLLTAMIQTRQASGETSQADAEEEEPAVEAVATEEAASVEEGEKAVEETEEEAEETAEPDEALTPQPAPKPELSAAMGALRDRLRRTTAAFYGRRLTTAENTATDLMNYCLAFGCRSEIHQGNSSSKKINGITCLCWNYRCGGYEPLVHSGGRIAARIGYGTQAHPSQLLAVLALSRVKPDYPARAGEHIGTVAELIEHEKLSCRSGADLSLKLIGLSYYVEEPTWENDLGEQWSIQRILKEELDKPLGAGSTEGTDRLMGLSHALAGHVKRERPVEGQFLRVQKFLADYYEYALALQNADGSWGPNLLAGKGASRDQAVQLRSTGHVLRWLVMSLPEEQLEDARVVRSVDYLNRLLGGSRYRGGVRGLSTREIDSLMHALHALVVYDERYLQPRTPQPTPKAT